jgi:hypothetical protein
MWGRAAGQKRFGKRLSRCSLSGANTPTMIRFPHGCCSTLTGSGVASLYPVHVLRLVKRRRESLKDRFSEVSASDPGWLQVWAWSILAVISA